MDQISILSLVLVSFPEAVLLSLFGILLVGKHKFLYVKSNYIRIIIYAIIIPVSTYFTRRVVSNVVEIILISIFISALLYIFILRFKFYESILAAIIGFFAFLTIQTVTTIAVMALSGLSINAAYLNDLTRFLVVLPERIVEVAFVLISLKCKIKIIDFEGVTIKRKVYYIQLFVYIISIGTLLFLSVIMVNAIFFDNTNSTNIMHSNLTRFNIYLTLFVTIILTLAVRSINESYKSKSALSNNELLQSLNYIMDLLKQENYQEATKVTENLKSHIESK